MVIYVDTLIFTNVVIDYLLLCITSMIVKKNYNIIRLIISSLIGGVSSLYILVDSKSIIVDIIFKIIVGALMILVLCGNKKGLLLSYSVFLGISFLLNGCVIFLYNLVSPNVFYSDNFINYFNISPVLLIVLTSIIYFIIKIIQRIFIRKTAVSTANLSIQVGKLKLTYRALVDSGNTLSDPFGNSQIFVLSCDEFSNISLVLDEFELSRRNRLIPVKTVSSKCVLKAIRCDKAEILAQSKRYVFDNPIIASSIEPIENDCKAIIPANLLERICD